MATGAKLRPFAQSKKRLHWWIICGIIGALWGVSCSPQTSLLLPTIAVIPSDTPTFTPSVTPLPSDTETSTDTLVPSDTLSPTDTLTLTPAQSYTPIPSPTISLTPSYTLPPPSLTPTTAPPTDTPTPVPTLAPPTPTVGPVIISFTSDLMTVPTNGQTILRWKTDADTITLDELTASGTTVISLGVDPIGDRSVLLPASLGQSVIFRLTAKRGGHSISQSLTIAIQCAIPWFFSPAPSGCPQQAAFPPSAIKYQAFEKGVGFFAAVTNQVYLLANAGNRVNAYVLDSSYSPPPPTNTPPGMIQPQGEIGWVWTYKRWSDGSQLVNALGWGTAPMQTYVGIVQEASTTDLYLQGPSGAVYKLALAGTGTWSIVGNVK